MSPMSETPPDGLESAGRPLGVDQSASPAACTPAPAPESEEEGGGPGRRFWSARRIPAALTALTALVVLAAAGLLLYDIAAVRADRPGMRWRRELVRELAERPLDDIWVLTGAAVALLLGLWLLILALTPGLRGLLPMRRTHPDMRAGLDRVAAALVLRDRAMEVSGVQSVRVAMGRHKVKVRALSHFRELDDVRADMDVVLAGVLRELGLATAPTLSVYVARSAKKG
jgi:hypothetical protein